MGPVGDAWCVKQGVVSQDSGDKDHWSGVQDPVERRKRQNRLRQRSWRERGRAIGNLKTTAINTGAPWEGHGILIATNQHDSVIIGSSSISSKSPSSNYQVVSLNNAPIIATAHESRQRDKLIPPLLPYATDVTLGRPTPTVTFPLSADHFLITLVQYNVMRAILFNMSILSLLDSLPTECSRSFGISNLNVTPPESIPLDLQPTLLQQSTPHAYWIKAIPFPAMRDNLILMVGKYDSDDLCYDLGKGLYDGFDDVGRRGFLVWGEPWSASGWEVSDGFVRKWGFLLKGCADVIDSTNRWREVRGDDKLIMMI